MWRHHPFTNNFTFSLNYLRDQLKNRWNGLWFNSIHCLVKVKETLKKSYTAILTNLMEINDTFIINTCILPVKQEVKTHIYILTNIKIILVQERMCTIITICVLKHTGIITIYTNILLSNNSKHNILKTKWKGDKSYMYYHYRQRKYFLCQIS